MVALYFLCRIKNAQERAFYEIEATRNNWNLEELHRQFNTSLYERLALSADKEKIQELSTHGQIIKQPKDLIKDPFILEFLGLEEKPEYSEDDLETAIINKIEAFILELGKGFSSEGGKCVSLSMKNITALIWCSTTAYLNALFSLT